MNSKRGSEIYTTTLFSSKPLQTAISMSLDKCKMSSSPSSPTPSPEPGIQSLWNVKVVATVVALCIILLILSYCRILKQWLCRIYGVTFLRNRFQGMRLSYMHFEDFSFQFPSAGLESSIMKALPTDQVEPSNNECAVCLGEFEDGEWLKHRPNCTHVFHVACIDTWFQAHSNCPLCRSSIYDPTLKYAHSVSTPNVGHISRFYTLKFCRTSGT